MCLLEIMIEMVAKMICRFCLNYLLKTIPGLMLIVIVSGCGAGDVSAPEMLKQAKLKEGEGNYRESIVIYKDVLSREPKNSEGRWLLGNLYVRLGFGVEAEKELRIAKELGVSAEAIMIPLAWSLLQQQRASVLLSETEKASGLSAGDRATILMLRGRAYLTLPKKDVSSAKNAFRQSQALAPGSVSALVSGALIEVMEERMAEAAKYFERAASMESGWADTWMLLGDTRLALKELKLAEEAYSKAITASGINAMAAYKRALVRVQLHKYASARSDLEMAKRFGLQPMMYYFVSGLADIAEDKFDDAQTHLEEARRQDERYIPTYYYLALTHLALNNLVLAGEAVEKYLNVFPESSDALSLKARLLLLRNDYSNALEISEKLISRNPDDIQMLAVCGQSALMLRQVNKSIGCFDNLVRMNPAKPQFMASLGASQIAAGSIDKGLDTLGAAARIAPQNRGLMISYIVNLLMQGRYETALAKVRAIDANNNLDDLIPLQLEAKALLGMNDLAGAKSALDKSLKVSPGNSTSLIALADIDLKEGHPSVAAGRYNEIIKYSPNNVDALMGLAKLESERLHFGQARKLLERAVESNPSVDYVRIELAKLYLVTGQANNVLRVLEPLREFFDKNPELLRLIGSARLQEGDAVSAIQAFEQRIRLQPNSAMAHYDLAKAYMVKGDKRGWIELEQSTTMDPEFTPARVAVVRYLQLHGESSRAQAEMTYLRNKLPNDPEVLAQAGWLAIQQRQYQDAIGLYRQAFAALPSAEISLELANALILNGDSPEAVKVLVAWTQYGTNDRRIWFSLARLYEAAHDNNNAGNAYLKMLEIQQDDVLALNNLAMLQRNQNPEQAMRYAERAYAIAPKLVNVADTYAVLLMDQHEFVKAVRVFQAVKADAVSLPQVRLHYGNALIGSNDLVGARRVLLSLVNDFESVPEREMAVKILDKIGR